LVTACSAAYVHIWRGFLTLMAAVAVSMTVAGGRSQNPHQTSAHFEIKANLESLDFLLA
jgi:hypothetical protein